MAAATYFAWLPPLGAASGPSAGMLFLRFERAVSAWQGADPRTRAEMRNEDTRNALDAAVAMNELRTLRAYGGREALADLLGRAGRLLEKARRRERSTRKSDAGWILVEWARQGLADDESSEWIAEKLASNLPHEVSAGLTLEPQSWGGYHLPSDQLVAKAAKAIEKHRRSTKSLTDRDGDTEGIARVCVQHALEAFGLSAPRAKITAGQRRKGV